MKRGFVLFTAYLLAGVFFRVDALEDSLRSLIDPSQQSEGLKAREKIFDAEIKKLNQDFARYKSLLGIDVKITPEQTSFTKNDQENWIQLESFSFVPESYIFTNIVGVKYTIVKLYFGPGGLSKIETRIYEDNYITEGLNENLIIDPSPNTDDTSDIQIVHQTKAKPPYRSVLGKMQNTDSMPLGVKFKKEYIRHLGAFLKLFSLVEDYQIRYGNNVDKNIIDTLVESLSY